MAEIEVKGQRSCEIWQSLKKDVNAHGFVIIIRRKLFFGRMTENKENGPKITTWNKNEGVEGEGGGVTSPQLGYYLS